MNFDNFLILENICLASTAFFNVILFIIIIADNKRTRNNYYFALFILLMTFWIVTTLLFYVIDNPRWLDIIIHLVYTAPPFLPMFIILFTKTFPKQRTGWSKMKLRIFVAIPAVVSALTLLPNTIIRGATIVDGYERVILFGPFYFIYVICLVVYFAVAIFLMVKKYLILHGRERNQVEIIFLSFTLGSLVGVYTSLIMPTMGDFSLFWAGSFYSGYLVLSIFYGIARYGLFDIKLVTTEFIALITWLVLFGKLFFSKNSTDRTIDFVILALVIVSGILVIKAVTKEAFLREKDDELVDNIRGLNQRLEKTNIDLKALDQKKSEFMALATHQLRAPLTAMKGYSSMILDGTFGKIENPEMADAVNKISRSTTDLTMIVEDYLNISRIEQGRMQYNFTTVDITNLIKNVISDVKSTTDRLGLIMNLNYDSAVKYNVNVDEGKIKQVFSNIIDNAIKYTPTGHIDVFVKTEGSKVVVKIEDTGVGIRSEVLPSLFHKFVRAPDASKINILGTGLGLYVAGEILKAHNGRAWGESEGEGRGSTFFVELPAV